MILARARHEDRWSALVEGVYHTSFAPLALAFDEVL